MDTDKKDKSLQNLSKAFSFKPTKITDEKLGRKKEAFGTFLKQNVDLYDIAFIDSSENLIISFHFWCFINGRWVFFVKPLRAYREINRLRDNNDVRLFSKMLRRLMKWRILPKEIKNLGEDEMSMAVRHVIRHVKKED